MTRMEAAREPFGPFASTTLHDFRARGVPHIEFFAVLARDDRLFRKVVSASMIDEGHLTVRQREIAVARVTAKCHAEYEWGIHVALFGQAAGLSQDDYRALFGAGAGDGRWTEAERLIITAVDTLIDTHTIDDDLWNLLRGWFSPECISELVILAGHYLTVSMLGNAWKLKREPFAPGFPCA